MRLNIIVPFLLLTAPLAKAEFLTADQRAEIIEKLAKIQEAANQRVDARFRIAINAYNQAMGSNEAALDLYLNCIQKVRFEDRYKDNRDYREWRDKEEDKFSEPSFKLALRHQLRWLVLTLKASSQDPDLNALAAEAGTIVDSIFADISKFKDQQQTLNQAATSSVFAQAYGINNIKADWPSSPIAISEIYESVIMPPLRSPMKLKSLRAAWIKRIKLEEINSTAWINTKTDFRKNGRRDADRERDAREALRDETQINEEKFQNQTYPQLVWKMEADLFANGDEMGAAGRMLEHIQKYITHDSAKQWAEELQLLLNPETEEPTTTSGN